MFAALGYFPAAKIPFRFVQSSDNGGHMAEPRRHITDAAAEPRQLVEEHLQLIERLRGGTTARLGADAIRPLLAELIRRAGPAYWTYSLPRIVKVHRSRPLESGDDWHRFTERDLGPPPPDKVMEYARCNRPSQSLLYCSLEENIALAEMQAARGQTHLITTYLLDSTMRLRPIGELDFFRRTGGLTYFGDSTSIVARHYADMVQDINVMLIDAFLADEFMRYAETDAVYFLTSTVADILFAEAKGHVGSAPDALFYPSVVFRSGVNFAIAPHAYAEKVSLVTEETKIVRITEVLGYGLYRYDTLALLETGEGQLSWKDC